MKKFQPFLLYSVALLCGAALLLFSACEISGGDEVTREVSLNVAGAYQNSSGIASQQTGQRVTLLSIMQSGDQLNAVDNTGAPWRGTIGRAEGNTATFTLDGTTSTGAAVVLTGTIVVNSTTGTLSGTWIEPSLRAAASAQATVAAQATPTANPVPTASVTPGIATPTPIP